MPDIKKVIKGLEIQLDVLQKYADSDEMLTLTQEQAKEIVVLLKEQEGLLGIQQTVDGITFVSTGTAQQGEARGLLLGKLAMHEWLKKELLYRGLPTNDIRAVFDEAKQKECR